MFFKFAHRRCFIFCMWFSILSSLHCHSNTRRPTSLVWSGQVSRSNSNASQRINLTFAVDTTENESSTQPLKYMCAFWDGKWVTQDGMFKGHSCSSWPQNFFLDDQQTFFPHHFHILSLCVCQISIHSALLFSYSIIMY